MTLRSLRCIRCSGGDCEELGKVYMYPAGNYHKACKALGPAKINNPGIPAGLGKSYGQKKVLDDNLGYRRCRCEDYPCCGH